MEWGGFDSKTEPGVEKLSEIEEKITSNTILVGTGWHRLNLEKWDKIKTYGTEAESLSQKKTPGSSTLVIE